MLVIMRLMAVNVKYVQDVIKSVLLVCYTESYQKRTSGVQGLTSVEKR